MSDNFDHFHARLLDASLQEYSRVSPSEDFASRVLAKKDVAPRTWLGWLWIPAVAALACGLLIMRPVPPAPPQLRARVGQASLPAAVSGTAVSGTKKSGRQGCLPHCAPPFHVLTGVELASMNLPPALFAMPKEEPVSEIVIEPLTVAPLDIPSIPDSQGEKQP